MSVVDLPFDLICFVWLPLFHLYPELSCMVGPRMSCQSDRISYFPQLVCDMVGVEMACFRKEILSSAPSVL